MDSDDRILFSAIFGILALINLLGNAATCVVVVRIRSLHTPTNYLLLNLSVANLVMAVFSAGTFIFGPTYEHPDGLAGDYLCKFITGENIFWVGGVASSFSLSVIAYERFRAIVYPHDISKRLNGRKLKLTITICWIYAIVLNVPNFITSKVKEVNSFRVCHDEWTADVHRKVWAVSLVIISFLFPLTIVTILYSSTVYHLYKRPTHVADVSHMAVFKARKRITVTLIAITVLFAVCWAPDGATYIVLNFSTNTLAKPVRGIPLMREVAILLVCVNSAMHPFLCAVSCQEFRKGFRRTVSFWKNNNLVAVRPRLQLSSRQFTINRTSSFS